MKLNGISTGKSRMARKLLPAKKLVRDLWKMEFKDMESTLGDMEVDVAMGSCVGSVKERKISQDGIRWNMKKIEASLRD